MKKCLNMIIFLFFLPSIAFSNWYPIIEDGTGLLLGHCYSAEPSCFDVIPLGNPQDSCYLIDIYTYFGSIPGPPYCVSVAQIAEGTACYDMEVWAVFWDPYIQSEIEVGGVHWFTEYDPFFSSTVDLVGNSLLFTSFVDGVAVTTDGTIDVYFDGLTYLGWFANPLDISTLDLSSAVSYTYFQYNSVELDGCFNTLQAGYVYYNPGGSGGTVKDGRYRGNATKHNTVHLITLIQFSIFSHVVLPVFRGRIG